MSSLWEEEEEEEARLIERQEEEAQGVLDASKLFL